MAKCLGVEISHSLPRITSEIFGFSKKSILPDFFLTADPHQMVIDHTSEVIGGETIPFQQHKVLLLRPVVPVPVDQVLRGKILVQEKGKIRRMLKKPQTPKFSPPTTKKDFLNSEKVQTQIFRERTYKFAIRNRKQQFLTFWSGVFSQKI